MADHFIEYKVGGITSVVSVGVLRNESAFVAKLFHKSKY